MAQSKKWCLFLQKGADGGRRVPFFPVLPPLSPRTPPGCCGAAGGGFRARSHVLPAQPSRACRGRSRHAPAVLGRRKQIGFPAGVQGAGRPWLVSHHRSVGTGCGERPGRAGMEGADLAEGSPQAAGSLQEAGFDKEPRMLPLPLFTSGAEVGLFFGGWEVLMCCPQTPS